MDSIHYIICKSINTTINKRNISNFFIKFNNKFNYDNNLYKITYLRSNNVKSNNTIQSNISLFSHKFSIILRNLLISMKYLNLLL